tara:strand:- start:3222 stop:3911 length:690 start_codon:yes stop_codon:yes gene_type:complete
MNYKNNYYKLNEQIPEYVFRIILVGDSSSGKSSFLNRFCNDSFDSSNGSTIGVDFRTKIMKIDDNKVIKFQIWDTAGQENFYSICRSYYLHTCAAFVVYDITNKKTFDNLNIWIKRLKENNDNFNENKHGIIYLIGNKIDLEEKREIKFEEGLQFAHKNKLLFSETSCKTGNSVYSTGERLANTIYYKIKEGKIKVNDSANPSTGIKMHNQSIYINIKETNTKNNNCSC